MNANRKAANQYGRRLWIITELYYPEQTSTGHLLTTLAVGLAERMPVSVICNQPTYSKRGLRAPRIEQRQGVHIRRCRATTLNKDILPFRILNLLTFTFSVFFAAFLNIRRGDVILVVTTPPSLPFAAALACRLRGAKCLLLIHDVYPEVLVAVGITSAKSMAYRIVGWLTRLLYRNVQSILVLGRDMRELVVKRLGNRASQVTVISNWADLDQIHPLERSTNSLLGELDLRQKFVVQYSGNMGRSHDLESIVESAYRLNADDSVHFLLIGSGAKRASIEATVRTKALRNVTLLSERPRGDLVNSLNASDVAIISFVPGMAGISVPSRTYNVMAAGKPIIAVVDTNSEIALLVNEEAIGWVVPPNQPDKLVAAILEAQADPQRLAQMGKRARAAAEVKYSFQHVIEVYSSLIDSI